LALATLDPEGRQRWEEQWAEVGRLWDRAEQLSDAAGVKYKNRYGEWVGGGGDTSLFGSSARE
jgi:hypothetical protein